MKALAVVAIAFSVFVVVSFWMPWVHVEVHAGNEKFEEYTRQNGVDVMIGQVRPGKQMKHILGQRGVGVSEDEWIEEQSKESDAKWWLAFGLLGGLAAVAGSVLVLRGREDLAYVVIGGGAVAALTLAGAVVSDFYVEEMTQEWMEATLEDHRATGATEAELYLIETDMQKSGARRQVGLYGGLAASVVVAALGVSFVSIRRGREALAQLDKLNEADARERALASEWDDGDDEWADDDDEYDEDDDEWESEGDDDEGDDRDA